ncbi:MAG: hypothetical protein WBN18_03105 [Flavobacteriaceae bacterium]
MKLPYFSLTPKPFILMLVFAQALPAQTSVSIVGDQFHINGEPTYNDRTWNGHRIEGLLFNSRMVQGIFDDLNPETRERFQYPDTGIWDAERNTDEFVLAMKSWREHGLLAFTLNLQGGSPMGYGNAGWINSTFDEKGALRPKYLSRLDRILKQADTLGMVVILGYFYFGQDQHLENETAVIRAVDNITHWLLEKDYRNILVEVNNECDIEYDHEILQPERVHELIARVQKIKKNGFGLLAGTSYGGGRIPKPNVVRQSDFILLHGNGVKDPRKIGEMVTMTRAVSGYDGQPILFNEDDHYDFDNADNNMVSAVKAYASWGFFDFRRNDEGLENGFQSVPVDWGITSKRKRDFFDLVKMITGY